jgi:hypothetical protein
MGQALPNVLRLTGVKKVLSCSLGGGDILHLRHIQGTFLALLRILLWN